MRTKTWIRFTLASAIFTVGGLGVLAAGCSDDADGDADTGTDGSTLPDGNTIPDAKPDTSPDAPAPAAFPKIALVHGAAGLPPVKFCIAVGESTFTINTPLPESGIPYGFGGYLPIQPALAALIPGVELTAYAIPTAEATAGKTCSDLTKAADAGGAANVVKLPKFPVGTFKAGKSYFVVALGCGPAGAQIANGSDVQVAGYHCGSDWNSTNGNVRVAIVEVDRTAPAANEVGAQFYHLSPQTNALISSPSVTDGGATGFQPAVSWLRDAATEDAPDATAVATEFLSKNEIRYLPDGGATPLAKSTRIANNLANPSTGVNGYLPGADGDGGGIFALLGGSLTGVPFSSIPFLGLASDAGVTVAAQSVKAGASYTFVAAGDPQNPLTPDAGADKYLGFRVIVIPNNPVFPGE